MVVSQNGGSPQSSISKRFSVYKRSILGYPSVWQPPVRPVGHEGSLLVEVRQDLAGGYLATVFPWEKNWFLEMLQLGFPPKKNRNLN